MFTEERYQIIKDLLQEQNIVKMQDIVQVTGSSESTIRRDLSALEEEGVLIRVHGGAKRGYKLQPEPEMEIKSSLNMDEKRLIAKRAADFIENDDVLFLDAGSTTYEMIPFLQGKKITVVTNGVPHASLLADLRIPTILLGGKIKLETKAIIGSTCLSQLEGYRFNKVFLGMNGIDSEFGFTTPDIEEAAIKAKAVEHGARKYILADSSKFGVVSFAKVADLADCDVISVGLDERKRKRLEQETTYWEAKV